MRHSPAAPSAWQGRCELPFPSSSLGCLCPCSAPPRVDESLRAGPRAILAGLGCPSLALSVRGCVDGQQEPGTALSLLHSLPRGTSPGSCKASALPAAFSVGAVPCEAPCDGSKARMGWWPWLWASCYQPWLPGCLLFPEHLPQYFTMAPLLLTFFLTK